MKRGTIIIAAIAALALAYQQPSRATTNEVPSSAKELGAMEGKSITNGFVFIDGEYLEPPYVVTRQGNGIFINDHLVEQPCPWPIPEKVKPVVPKDDPEMPKTITKDTTQYDKELIQYLADKKGYLQNKYGEVEMVKIMIEVFSHLPCVSRATTGPDQEHVTVTWADGSTMNYRLVMPKRKITEWTRESILERTNKDRANYEERLSNGDYYFLGSYGRMTGTADGARMVLGALLPVLKTSKDAKEVQQRMTQAGFPYFDEQASKAFFTHRTHSKQLDERVDALTKSEK